jgi:hypothetical protein
MQRNLLVILVVVAAAFIFLKNKSRTGERAETQRATQLLASTLCDQDALKKTIDAYPQAHMSKDELSKQTLGEGMQRLQTFQAKLPGIVEPLLPALRADSGAWDRMSDLAKRAMVEFRKPAGDASFKNEYEGFVRDTVAAMRESCPSQFKNDANSEYAEFGVGAIVGRLGAL